MEADVVKRSIGTQFLSGYICGSSGLFVLVFWKGGGIWAFSCRGQAALKETEEQSAPPVDPGDLHQPGPSTWASVLLPAALKGSWQSGFFDQGSFKEIMAPWAQTVVTGRAR